MTSPPRTHFGPVFEHVLRHLSDEQAEARSARAASGRLASSGAAEVWVRIGGAPQIETSATTTIVTPAELMVCAVEELEDAASNTCTAQDLMRLYRAVAMLVHPDRNTTHRQLATDLMARANIVMRAARIAVA